MPLKVSTAMSLRLEFVHRWKLGLESVAQLCREFGISRKTGYQILHRYNEEGEAGLESRSRRPHSSPRGMAQPLREEVLAVRYEHPRWGPKKILAFLQREHTEGALPSRSAIARLLKRENLVRSPKRSFRVPPPSDLVVASAPNEVWCMDFKGHFRVGNGERCDTLTVMDSFSRKLLVCEALFGGTTTEKVRTELEKAFFSFGLPRYMLTDNGSPFASTGAGGLTHLSAWFVKLGITPLRIEPGKPQQNGRLERLHRTLKAEAISPPEATPKKQQEKYLAFQKEYNEVRPHEGLEMRTPESLYTRSEREYKKQTGPWNPAYGEEMIVKQVKRNGLFTWNKVSYFVSSTLSEELIGLKLEGNAGVYSVWLGDYQLGILDLKEKRVVSPGRNTKNLVIPITGTEGLQLDVEVIGIEPKRVRKAQPSGLCPEPPEPPREGRRNEGEKESEEKNQPKHLRERGAMS